MLYKLLYRSTKLGGCRVCWKGKHCDAHYVIQVLARSSLFRLSPEVESDWSVFCFCLKSFTALKFTPTIIWLPPFSFSTNQMPWFFSYWQREQSGLSLESLRHIKTCRHTVRSHGCCHSNCCQYQQVAADELFERQGIYLIIIIRLFCFVFVSVLIAFKFYFWYRLCEIDWGCDSLFVIY